MRLARTALLSALALNALLGVGMAVRAQSVSAADSIATVNWSGGENVIQFATIPSNAVFYGTSNAFRDSR